MDRYFITRKKDCPLIIPTKEDIEKSDKAKIKGQKPGEKLIDYLGNKAEIAYNKARELHPEYSEKELIKLAALIMRENI